MTSSPGLRRWSRLKARRGVLQTTTTDADRRQRAKQYWPSYTMCRRASNKQQSFQFVLSLYIYFGHSLISSNDGMKTRRNWSKTGVVTSSDFEMWWDAWLYRSLRVTVFTAVYTGIFYTNREHEPSRRPEFMADLWFVVPWARFPSDCAPSEWRTVRRQFSVNSRSPFGAPPLVPWADAPVAYPWIYHCSRVR